MGSLFSLIICIIKQLRCLFLKKWVYHLQLFFCKTNDDKTKVIYSTTHLSNRHKNHFSMVALVLKTFSQSTSFVSVASFSIYRFLAFQLSSSSTSDIIYKENFSFHSCLIDFWIFSFEQYQKGRLTFCSIYCWSCNSIAKYLKH